MYKKIFILLAFILEINTFTLRCNNDYLININKKKVDKPFNKVRTPLYHTTFDNAFINTISHKIINVKKTQNNDRLLLEYNDNKREIYFDKQKDINKILDLIRLVGNITISTISDFNYFESIYSPYYSTKEI